MRLYGALAARAVVESKDADRLAPLAPDDEADTVDDGVSAYLQHEVQRAEVERDLADFDPIVGLTHDSPRRARSYAAFSSAAISAASLAADWPLL